MNESQLNSKPAGLQCFTLTNFARHILFGAMMLGLAACNNENPTLVYTVLPSAGDNGSISPNGEQRVDHGRAMDFTLTPDTGYSIGAVIGTCGGRLADNVYTTHAITGDCTVRASFVLNTYAVSPVAGVNGSISPNDAQTVDHDSTTSFTITPNTGYSIDSVAGSCSGSLSGNTYTTAAISSDCTVEPSFKLNSYSVSPSAGANGSISPNSAQSVNHGGSVDFTITPDANYTIDAVTGTCGGSLVGSTFTTDAITDDCTVDANFNLTSYTVSALKGANGSISPAAQTVTHDDTTSFTLTPNTNYSIDSVGGSCGGTLSGNTFITAAITSDCTVEPSFRLNNYAVTPSAGDNGSITPDAAQTIVHGDAAVFTITSDSLYTIEAVTSTCGGSLTGNTYTTDAVTADCSVTASFSAPTLSLTPTTIKTFRFNWPDVPGETEYRLLENPDGFSGYTEVATLVADTTSHDHQVFLPGRVNASYILEACNSSGCIDSVPVFVSGTLAEAVGYVKSSNTGPGDMLGFSLELSADGNTLAVGTFGEDSNATGIGGDESDNNANDSGAVYIFTRSGSTWSQQAYVKASNTGAGDGFGYSLALSADGNTLAVGAHGEDSNATGIGGDESDNSANGSGAVYVFTRTDATWSQQAYVKASNTEENDRFGASVALADDGNLLAAGASGEASNATGIGGDESDNSANGSGAVYVFTRNDANWSQQAYVKASNTEENDGLGISVALAADGNTLAVGASGEASNATGIGVDETDNSANGSGAAYVFTRSDATWLQQAYVKTSNTEANDRFGTRVALAADGNTLAVGAYGEDSRANGIDGNQANNDAGSSGAVYVFTRNDTTWLQQAYVKASNSERGDYFGWNLALAGDGNTLAVGAYLEGVDDATGINDNYLSMPFGQTFGAVYVFTRSDAIWSQQAYVKASNTGNDDQFGWSLSLAGDGNTLAVGARFEDSNATGVGGNEGDNSTSRSGAVYLY